MKKKNKYTEEEKELLKRKFKLSQSAIKQLLDRQAEPIQRCMKQFGNTYITKTDKLEKEIFKNGNLFEHLAIGFNSSHSKNNQADIKLKRLKPNKREKALGLEGRMTVTEIRIREQAEACKQLMKNKGWNISKDNTQVVIHRVINPEAPIEEWKIFRGEADIAFIPTKTSSFGDTISIIDLKATGNIENQFGAYAGWGNHKYMNKLQAISYLWAFSNIDYELNDILNPGNNLRESILSCGYNMIKKQNPDLNLNYNNLSNEEKELLSKMVTDLMDKGHMSFIYDVWDWSPKKGHLIVPVEIEKESSFILQESFRKSISIIEDMIEYYNKHGEFKEEPHPTLCSQCHIKNCKARDEGEFLY